MPLYHLFGRPCPGSKVTHGETTLIAGALELKRKKAKDAIALRFEIFVTDINANLDSYCID
jgi:hypothetical protein